MAVTLFKKVDYSLSKLIQDIEFGEIGLPDIQRPFVWTPAKVRDLFDSMYKGFPVGYLLFWANDHLVNSTRGIGSDQKQRKIPRLLIVDGQQRLTSLYAVLKGHPVYTQDFKPVNIHIAFRPRDALFEVTDAAIRRDPEFIPDISELWTRNWSSYKLVRTFLDHLRRSREISEEEEQYISDAIDRLFDLQNYPFTAMEISSTVSEEQVADIFVRINSKGVQLRQADFILTLLSVFWDEGRAELERFARESRQPPVDGRPSPYNQFIQPDPDQMLRVAIALGFKRARLQHVYSILRGKDLETGLFSDELRDQQFEVLKTAQCKTLDLQNWKEFLKSLHRAGYRSGTMISSQTSLLYSYAMYLIGQEEYQVPHHELRDLIACWFFMTTITGRYTGSPETIMDQDLARLRSVKDAAGFVSTLSRIIDDTLTNDFWEITLVNNLETSSPRSPALFAYYAALNLLDARVLFSKMKVSELFDPAFKGQRSSLERHHLFPRAYLKNLGYESTREINQVANYALVEWFDNMSITDQPPAEYFPVYERRFSKEELQEMMYWHALPEDWHLMDYETFLAERRKLIARVVRHGFEKLKAGGL